MARTHDMEDRPEMLSLNTGQTLKARCLVRDHFYGPDLHLDEVYIVWFAKTLQNWKALVSTNVKDDSYYEVTYNGDKNETYLDKYVKQVNLTVKDPPKPAFL